MNSEKLNHLTKEMNEKVKAAISQQRKLIFLDEAVFSQSTVLKKTWSLKNDNIRQLDMRHKIKTQALISAISSDYGLDHFMIKQKSINQNDFLEFLVALKDKYIEQNIVLFMDNLSVHKTKQVVSKMKELNITPIFIVPYSPQYNGIESYFFLVKQQFKKLLLQRILKGENLNVITLIKQSINLIDDDKVMNCALGGINEIMKIQ